MPITGAISALNRRGVSQVLPRRGDAMAGLPGALVVILHALAHHEHHGRGCENFT